MNIITSKSNNVIKMLKLHQKKISDSPISLKVGIFEEAVENQAEIRLLF